MWYNKKECKPLEKGEKLRDESFSKKRNNKEIFNSISDNSNGK